MAWTFYNASGEALTNFGPVALTDLDIDGGTAIGEAVVGADLFIADNGAGGTNVKVTATEIATFIGTDTDTRSGSAKAWVNISAWGGASASTMADNYNVDSVADNGAGDTTLTWGTDFASANTYVWAGGASDGRFVGQASNTAQAVGSCQFIVVIHEGTRTDSLPTLIVAFGDQ